MKQKLILFLILLVKSTLVYSYSFVVDGIYYNVLNESEVEVTYHNSYTYGSYSGDIVIPSQIYYNNVNYSVTTIGPWAFNKCVDLISVSLPNSIKEIKGSAFFECTKLNSIEIPFGVKEINESTFARCYELKSVSIPGSVISIKDQAFSGCGNLLSINIPNSVVEIGQYVFQKCRELGTIYFGNSLKTIGTGAFEECTYLTEVYSYAITPPVCSNYVFYKSYPEQNILHIPFGSSFKYERASGWKDFGTIIDDLIVEENYVDEICVDESNLVEIFNLRGERLNKKQDELSPGFYIIRLGGIVKKKIVK